MAEVAGSQLPDGAFHHLWRTAPESDGQEQEQAGEAGAEPAGTQIQLGEVGHGRRRGTGGGRPLLILASGQPDSTARLGGGGQGDDLFPEAVAVGGVFGAFGRGEEELPVRVLTELMDQDAEAARGVTAAPGGLG